VTANRRPTDAVITNSIIIIIKGGSVAEWLACWTQAQCGSGVQSRRCRVTVLGKLFTPIVFLFTEQQN